MSALTKRQIQARLVERGSSFRQFALTHGYQPRTVTQVLARWVGRPDLPNGRVSFRILRDLSLAIGEEVVPGILGPDYAPFACPLVGTDTRSMGVVGPGRSRS